MCLTCPPVSHSNSFLLGTVYEQLLYSIGKSFSIEGIFPNDARKLLLPFLTTERHIVIVLILSVIVNENLQIELKIKREFVSYPGKVTLCSVFESFQNTRREFQDLCENVQG